MEAISSMLKGLPGLGWLSDVDSYAESVGVPPGLGSLVFVAVVVLALILGFAQVGSEGDNGQAGDYGSDILVYGACGAGKTALVYTLTGSKMPKTVSSTIVDRVTAGGAEGAPAYIDFPGHATLRPQMEDLWQNVGGVILAVDSRLPEDHLRDTADCLVHVLTSPGFAIRDEPCPLMVVATKSDQPGAKSLPDLEAKLNAEMERKRESRQHIARDARGDAAPGGDDGGEGDDAGIGEQVVLGVAGASFNLRAHAHVALSEGGQGGAGRQATVRFVQTSCQKGDGLDFVRRFAAEVDEGFAPPAAAAPEGEGEGEDGGKKDR